MTVIDQNAKIDELSGSVKASSNALKISNLTDIFTQKFTTLSDSIDTRLSFFHPEGPDAEGLESLCDYRKIQNKHRNLFLLTTMLFLKFLSCSRFLCICIKRQLFY